MVRRALAEDRVASRGAGPAASPKVDSLHLSEDDQDDEKDYDEMLSAREELDADAS